jgi:isopentenyldiphosphate isomerase
MDDYYKQTQYLAQVNENDEIQGKVEKWEAHKNGILHRAFSVALRYKDSYIMQIRKHPAFNGYIDVTASSHPLYIGEEAEINEKNMQATLDAVYDCLEREWGIKKNDLKYEPKNLGATIYKASDKYGGFTEHELCYLFESEIETIPTPHFDVAYGYVLLNKEELHKTSLVTATLAPWVLAFIDKELL